MKFTFTFILALLDVRSDPVNVVSWGPLILLLAIVFILAMLFTGGLVVFLIWFKRRKTIQAPGAVDTSPST